MSLFRPVSTCLAVITVLVCLALMPACKSGSPFGPNPFADVRWCDFPSLGTMTAVINDSTQWIAVRVHANHGSSVLDVGASDCSNHLQITADLVRGLGSYSVEEGVFVNFSPEPPVANATWTANRTQGGSGSITVTRFEPTNLTPVSAAGTFAFVLVLPGSVDTMVIRGSFDTRATP